MKILISVITKAVLIASLSIILSCSNGGMTKRNVLHFEDIPLEKPSIEESFELDELIAPNSILCVGDYIILLSGTFNSTSDRKLLHLYRKSDMSFMGSYVHYGRGHDEVYNLHPYYYYCISDTSFVVCENLFYETTYAIHDDGIVKRSSKRMTDEVTSQIYRLGNARRLARSMDDYNQGKAEYVLLSDTPEGTLKKKAVGRFPKPPFHRGDLESYQLSQIYSNKVIAFDNSIYAVYSCVPLIRRYDREMILQEEYVMSKYQDYKITWNDFENLEAGLLGVLCSTHNKMTVYYEGAMLVVDDKLNVIKKIELPMYGFYAMDDKFLYVLDANTERCQIHRIRYTV